MGRRGTYLVGSSLDGAVGAKRKEWARRTAIELAQNQMKPEYEVMGIIERLEGGVALFLTIAEAQSQFEVGWRSWNGCSQRAGSPFILAIARSATARAWEGEMPRQYLERAMTECFWQTECNGAFVQEYPLTKKGIDRARRCADAVILPDEEHRRATSANFPSLADRNVVVVQTKAQRLGMYLMGQALFSARLVQALGAKSVRSILLCAKSDAALVPLLEPFPEVEVWVTDMLAPQTCQRQ